MVDSAGTTTYTYNAGNRLTLITDPSSNLTTNTYDNNGNLTVSNDNGTVTTNTWTYENRLKTVTLSGPSTTTSTYDGDGLRREKETAAGTVKFVWDGQDILLETDGDGTTQVTYTQTPAVYGSIVSQRRDSTTSFYHHDALGSTLALTGSDESVTDTYRFYAFAETLTSSGSTTNPFRYVGNLGYYNEAALALQYLRARYYQPSTGRFVSVDPVGLPSNYVYVTNNPVLFEDPSGEISPIIIGVVIGAAALAAIKLCIDRSLPAASAELNAGRDKLAHCLFHCNVSRCMTPIFGLLGAPTIAWAIGYTFEKYADTPWGRRAGYVYEPKDVRANNIGIRRAYRTLRNTCKCGCSEDLGRAGLPLD